VGSLACKFYEGTFTPRRISFGLGFGVGGFRVRWMVGGCLVFFFFGRLGKELRVALAFLFEVIRLSGVKSEGSSSSFWV
jgi:hypothetical protein